MLISGDLQKRIIGTFYFIPLFAAMLVGPPFSIVAGCVAIFWVAFEAVQLLTGSRAIWRGWLCWLAIVLVFFLAFAPVSATIMILVWASLCSLLLIISRPPAFVVLLMLSSFSFGSLLAKADGHLILICLAAVISAGDIGAYLMGRVIGGPKLAPHISPSKTWSGAVGGLLSSLLVVGGLLLAFDISQFQPFDWLFAVLIVILAQGGDLFESGLKRKSGIKDSGKFVPGHGGALDRFDGYLTVIPIVVLADFVDLMPLWLQVFSS